MAFNQRLLLKRLPNAIKVPDVYFSVPFHSGFDLSVSYTGRPHHHTDGAHIANILSSTGGGGQCGEPSVDEQSDAHATHSKWRNNA